jgi:phosphatidylinositol alpha-1,6-mannosyltransferase
MQGGSGRWLWELYRRLPAFDVAVLAGPAAGDAAFDAAAPLAIERLDRSFPSWGLLRPASARAYLSAARRLAALVDRHRPAVVHCGKCLPEGLVAAHVLRRSGIPFWCFAHGEELTLAETSRELRWWTRVVLGRAARIVANSRSTAGLLTGRWGVAGDRIAVLTPGVDTGRFVPAPPDPEVRARLGWQGRRVILTVGALQTRKGQDMLIQALPAIRRVCPDVLYAIAGEGWERARLQQLAVEHGVADAVAFLGIAADEDLVRLYQQCDLFALPNRQVGWDFEGFGIVLLEAQACGRAVLSGTSGGTAETMIPGETGELVPCDEPGGLAIACTALLEDPARRAAMGARGRAWVVERFDWPVLARRAAELFSVSLTADAD